jgi:predicted transposase/invertase (TIGR01784 family)
MSTRISEIDFSQLLDVRVDYLFKLIFGNDKPRLISLLNAIFANKNTGRVVTDLTFINTALEKESEIDKGSTIDIMATLSNGSTVCIEMHMYDLPEFKHKSLRTWAKVYGGKLKTGQKFWENMPVICISFIDGAIRDADGESLTAVHTLFQVRERDGHELLLHDMELHYINMRAFVKEYPGRDVPLDMFTKWLALITQSVQSDKGFLKEICKEDEVIAMALEVLASLSVDEATRLAYSRRQDDLTHYYAAMQQIEDNLRRAEEAERRAENERRRAEESDRRAENERRLLTNAVKAMHAQNWTVADIAEALGQPKEEIEKFL